MLTNIKSFVFCVLLIQYLESTNGDIQCAELLLYSDTKIANATFQLEDGEESFMKYKEVEKHVSVPYGLKLNLKTGCSLLICPQGYTNCKRYYSHNQDAIIKLSNPVKSVFCSCDDDEGIYCPKSTCPNDSESILRQAGQCGRGYFREYCSTCNNGYLVINPGDKIGQSDPQFNFKSVILREDCRLFNGNTIFATSSEKIILSRVFPLVCNCSDTYNNTAPVTKFPQTSSITQFPNRITPSTRSPYQLENASATTPEISQHTPVSDISIIYIPVTLVLVCLAVLCLGIVCKYRIRVASKISGCIQNVDTTEIESILLSTVVESDVIPEGYLTILQELNRGRFGIVELAEWYPRGRISGQFIKCVVKSGAERSSVRDDANNSVVYIRMHHRELETMRKLHRTSDHPNVIQFYGVWKNESAIALEFCERGDLKSYMENSENRCNFVDIWNIVREFDNEMTNENLREDLRQAMESFSTLMLIKWCAEVAAGMEFLVLSSILQMDLAARNVLLTRRYVAKISDFGLTGDLDENYVRVGYGDEDWLPPLPWLAPESKDTHIFSVKSSVWAFGVTVKEILCLGENLYPGVPAGSLVLTNGGYRLDMYPTFSNASINSFLLRCWKSSPSERPSFAYLKIFFRGEMDRLRLIVDTILSRNVQVENPAEAVRIYLPADSILLQSSTP